MGTSYRIEVVSNVLMIYLQVLSYDYFILIKEQDYSLVDEKKLHRNFGMDVSTTADVSTTRYFRI